MKKNNFARLKMLPFTEKENKSYYKQKLCFICKNEFNNDITIHQKIRDHDQYTGKCRGAAHLIHNVHLIGNLSHKTQTKFR